MDMRIQEKRAALQIIPNDCAVIYVKIELDPFLSLVSIFYFKEIKYNALPCIRMLNTFSEFKKKKTTRVRNEKKRKVLRENKRRMICADSDVRYILCFFF